MLKVALKLSKNKEVILIKEGELFLKGLNKKNFEAALIKNIKDQELLDQIRAKFSQQCPIRPRR